MSTAAVDRGRAVAVSLTGAVVLSLLLCAEPQSRYIIVLLKKFKKRNEVELFANK